ncbi:MAG: BrnT family toxin [Patescibacteria group bacterium]
MIDLTKIKGFEWDRGNIDKSLHKHGITQNEAESAFLDENLFFQEDIKHSGKEVRFIAIGKIKKVKMLFVAFTVRNDKVRIISARIANFKERRLYEEKVKTDSKI